MLYEVEKGEDSDEEKFIVECGACSAGADADWLRSFEGAGWFGQRTAGVDCSLWRKQCEGLARHLQLVGVAADSVHPLEAKDSMSPLAVVRDDDSAVVHLEFEVVPDSVSACAWDTALWNKTDVEAQAVDVAVDDEQTLTLLPYDAVYSVTATWDQENGCGGTAYYSFYTDSATIEQ